MAAETSHKYQKSLVFNPLLPYSELIDSEGDELFAQIKINLSIAIQKRELWPGALYWTNRLNSFIKVYGFHFSKEDHIKLVQLLFQLVTIPNLESPLLHCWSSLLKRLIKKKRFLSPSDIQFPWRPLYDLLMQISNTKFRRLGMRIYSDQTIKSVRSLIATIRCYFTIESTQEMLDEGRPYLCPFDTAMMDAMEYFNLFLPTLVPPEQFDHTHCLWFKELLHIWLESRNSAQLDEPGLCLFSRLVKDTVGHIDWSPYLEQIFTRILNNFELPMGIKNFQAPQTKKTAQFVIGDQIAIMIVYMLGGGSSAQTYLAQLMQALESYYHPSNIGFHTRKLLKFLEALTTQFVLRLKQERHTSKSWLPETPQSVRLTEKDIDDFVECLLPALWLSIFSKLGIAEAAVAVHNLALLRPAKVLPTLMEKTYAALETLTEPHQVVSTLSCVTVVSRTLLSGKHYPEGRSHLFMLLRLALPGIDPNDFRKMLASSFLISSLTTLVPLVDCSSAIGHVEMSDLDVELCSQTSQFEEFIDHFLERCFLVIENSGIHHQPAEFGQVLADMKRDTHETLIGAGLVGSVFSVLSQSSPELFQIALDKLFRFASTHVFESEVAGKMCAKMCGTASKVNAAATVKKFVPYCIENIENLLEDTEQVDSENPDIELIWNLQLLSHILGAADGDAILVYSDVLLRCFKLCVSRIKNKQAAKYSAKSIYAVLNSLTQSYPKEARVTPYPLDLDPKDHLYIKDWALTNDIKNASIQWHVPTAEEYQFADEILDQLLKPELKKLEDFMKGDTSLDRDSLLLSLDLVDSIVRGVSNYLPHITGPSVDGCPESVVPLTRSYYLVSRTTCSPRAEFSRQTLSEFFHRLKVHLMEKCEDDTKSLISLVKILKNLLVNFGADAKETEARWHYYLKQIKMVMGDKLRGKKSLVRPMIIMRAHLQHELRILDCRMSPLTPLHVCLLEDLVDLSVSMYAQVRVAAQNAISSCFDCYIFAGRKVLPKIIPYLKESPETTHEQFKGSLHLLLSSALTATTVHDWEQMRNVFVPLIQADHSEKPSILNLISRLHNSIQKTYDTFAIEFQVPESCLPVAAALHVALPPEELEDGKEKLEKFNKKSIHFYEMLIEDIVTITEGQQDLTQWRFTELSMKLLAMLVRHDRVFPIKGIQLFVNSLVHDALNIRKVAIFAMVMILQQLKRPLKKVPMNIEELAGVSSLSGHTVPGEREDNKWLCLDERKPQDEESMWNSNVGIVSKTRHGYYCYPKTLYGYAPVDEQPPLNRSSEEMSESERIVFKAFTDPVFVEKLVSFLSLEEVKGKDHYSTKRAQMFKNLFRNYGYSVALLFRPHLERLSIDNQESSQRCAAEIIAGLIRSSNHWPYNMVMEMRSWLEPLFRKVIVSIQMETVDDWVQCLSDISADRDPEHVRWLLELLMEDPLKGDNGAFVDSCHLSLLHIGLAQQEWRVPSLLQSLSSYLSPHLDHPFKNVREKIGTVLSIVYMMDANALGFQVLRNPLLSDLVKMFSSRIPSAEELIALSPDSPTLRTCKTAMSVIINSYQPSAAEFYQILGLVLPLAAYEGDDEVGQLVKAMCVQLSRRELTPGHISVVLETMKKAISSCLWKVKLLVLYVLQVLVFWNFFTFFSHGDELCNLLLSLLEDTQIEVRELASSTISGFVRCGFIPANKLKSLFTKQSQQKLAKKSTLTEEVDGPQTGNDGHLITRHCGVLGLAALVQSCPYTIPDWLPEVIDELSAHLHDPAPIPSTVKKAMSDFKRTHYDNWREHKLKFTEDQLSTLSDLLLSPSYYA